MCIFRKFVSYQYNACNKIFNQRYQTSIEEKKGNETYQLKQNKIKEKSYTNINPKLRQNDQNYSHSSICLIFIQMTGVTEYKQFEYNTMRIVYTNGRLVFHNNTTNTKRCLARCTA